MIKNVGNEQKFIDGSGGAMEAEGNHLCPKCGGKMVVSSQGVTASFPSPTLERLICTDPGCKHVKYVKMDSSGFTAEAGPVAKKGE